MLVSCKDCGSEFDDAARLTFCPHDEIMPADDLEQKKLGLALIGKPVRFAHEPNGPVRSVQSVGWNGMVTLEGMAGEFAPHLFVFSPVLQDEQLQGREIGSNMLPPGTLEIVGVEIPLPEPSAPSPSIPLGATICTYVAVDCETSGLPDWDKPADDPSQPWLAQMSMIFLDADFNELGRFSGYVKPEGWVMEAGATKVNGLTTEFLMEHGRPVGEVLDVYEAAIKAGAIVCAHNCQFDAKVGRSALRRAGRDDLFEQTYQFCTMREWAAHHGSKWPKLAQLCQMLGIDNSGPHTAEGDAAVVAKLLPLMRDLGIVIDGKIHRSSKPQFAKKEKA